MEVTGRKKLERPLDRIAGIAPIGVRPRVSIVKHLTKMGDILSDRFHMLVQKPDHQLFKRRVLFPGKGIMRHRQKPLGVRKADILLLPEEGLKIRVAPPLLHNGVQDHRQSRYR